MLVKICSFTKLHACNYLIHLPSDLLIETLGLPLNVYVIQKLNFFLQINPIYHISPTFNEHFKCVKIQMRYTDKPPYLTCIFKLFSFAGECVEGSQTLLPVARLCMRQMYANCGTATCNGCTGENRISFSKSKSPMM